MSILTKIFVVLQVVLVLLACPVFITQATVAPNYRDLWEKEKDRSKMYAQSAQHAGLAMNMLREQLTRAENKANDAEAQRSKRESELLADKAEVQTAYAGLEAIIKRMTAEMQGQQAIVQDFSRRYDLLTKQGRTQRDKINELIESNNRMNSMLKDEQTKVERIGKIAKVYSEKIVELQDKIEELNIELVRYKRGDKAPMPGGKDDRIPDTPPIEGTILAVDGAIASINVGSARGVRRGMRLVIYRGSNYVGRLHIVEVNARSAAGSVVDSPLQPQIGDKVVSSEKLAAGGR